MGIADVFLVTAVVFASEPGWQPAEDRPLMGLCPHNPGLALSQRYYRDGFRWIRADFGWHHIQPEKGVWQWDDMDRAIEANREAGHGVLGLVGYAPSWACQDKGRNLGAYVKDEDFRLFIHETVTRYRDRIKYWEIWNEPNIPPFWRPLGEPEEYGRLLAVAYDAIKAVDPELKVVTGGTSRTDIRFIAGFVAAAERRCFDIVSYHPYSFSPESQLRQDVERIRDVLEDAGIQGVPVWITEDASGETFVLRNYCIAAAAGVEKLFTYDDPYTGGGNNSMEAPFRTCSDLLGKARYLGRVAPGGNEEIHLFEDGGPFMIAWDLEGRTASFPLKHGVATVTDHLGNETKRPVAVPPETTAGFERTRRHTVHQILNEGPVAIRGAFPLAFILEACLTPDSLPARPHAASRSARTLGLSIRCPSFFDGRAAWRVVAKGPTGWTLSRDTYEAALSAGEDDRIVLRVEAPESEPPGAYPIDLEVEAKYRQVRHAWTRSVDAVIEPKTKWVFETDQEIHCSPIVADLDGDGTLEVLFGSDDRNVYCMDPKGEVKWSFFAEAAVRATMAVADTHPTPGLECHALLPSAQLISLSAVGKLLWSVEMEAGSDWGGCLALDLEGDGSVEILCATNDGHVTCVKGNTGQVAWVHKAAGGNECPLSAGDVDGDKMAEIVVPVTDQGILCLRADGSVAWRHTEQVGWHSSPAVADVDGDGRMEVLASSGEGNPGLHCFDGSSGVKQWYAETPYAIDAGVAVGDLEGDGEKEIVICDLGGWVFCLGGKRGENEPIFSLDGKGQEKWRFKLGAGADASPTLADTDGDGKQEVLIGSSDRYVYCLDHDGRLVWKLRTDMKVNTSPAVADLEDDGHVEILIGSRDTKLYCLQASGKGPASWPMKRGGPASTASIE